MGDLPVDAIGRSVDPATPRSNSRENASGGGGGSGGSGGGGRESKRGSVGALFCKMAMGMSASRLSKATSVDSLHGASALWRAAANGHADVCRELLRAGAEADASFQGRTPRQSAKLKGHAATVAVFDEDAAETGGGGGASGRRKSHVTLERSSTGDPGAAGGGGGGGAAGGAAGVGGGGALLKRNSQVFSGDL